MKTLALKSSLLTPLFFLSLLSLSHCYTELLQHETDREALLEFKSQIDEQSLGALTSWNDTLDHCQWTGIICSKKHRQRVVGVNLQGQNLAGLLSSKIGNLSFLRVLNLANNSFRGIIPQEVGHLLKLQNLTLSYNFFQGNIPYTLSNCTNLESIGLGHNLLHGHIPSELGSLSKLTVLSLHDNNLTGEVPKSIGNLSSLQILVLVNNQLEELPNSIALLKNLIQLGLSANKFSGNFPSFIYNLTSLQVLGLSYNSFSGNLRPDIGLVLPKLQTLFLSSNKFTGHVPVSLGNTSKLSSIDMSNNNFTGDVPLSFGYLQDLTYVNLEDNLLGGNAEDMNFIASLSNCSYLDLLSFTSNNFQGILPLSITNLSTQLTWLSFGENFIHGSIPEEFVRLSNLYAFGAEDNLLTGSIPRSFGRHSNLQVFSVAGNNLSGIIPSSVGNMSALTQLLVNNNHLQGSLPSSIRNIKSLQILDLSSNEFEGFIPKELFGPSAIYSVNMSNNRLNGSLPLEIGEWTGLTSLDVSNNNLSGTIPTTIKSCLSLEELHMQRNMFSGNIPNIRELQGIQIIDLSHNNLSGKIPSFMVNMSVIEILNLSFNELDGEVPTEGIFLNSSAFDIYGNTRLCGGISELHLSQCPKGKERKTERHNRLKYVLLAALLSLLFSLVLVSFVLFFTRKQRTRKPLSYAPSPSKHFFPRISYQELFNATDGFSEDNLIGSGTFGSVYKGTIEVEVERTTVAVKVLNLQQPGALKSFVAECNALRNIRHRNLVKVLTACSSLDPQGKDFKAIVYQYMPNGSLDTWLHEAGRQLRRHLNLRQRINIAIDVAHALHYLHEECESPVIHCDLKPSNVLLDEDLTARVSDFGLAKLLSEDGGVSISSQLSTAGIRGTIGYTAPEYGMGSQLSTHGDIYSFGVMLLEMFTSRRPIDDQYQGNFNLHDFVKTVVPSQVMQIIDRSLLCNEEETEGDGKQEQTECLLTLLQVGLACSKENPKDRMKIEEVISKLVPLREKCVGAKLSRSFGSDDFVDNIEANNH